MPTPVFGTWQNPQQGLSCEMPFNPTTFTTMRIKLTTLPPLPASKSLFLLPSTTLTIHDLKLSLLAAVPALKGLKVEDVELEIDGFGLLDGDSVEVVDAARDVIW